MDKTTAHPFIYLIRLVKKDPGENSEIFITWSTRTNDKHDKQQLSCDPTPNQHLRSKIKEYKDNWYQNKKLAKIDEKSIQSI
jgi:hypothetical protein